MKKKGTTKKPGTAKKALPKKPGKSKGKTATLSVMLGGVETDPVAKRWKPAAADIEKCEKALKDARKANPLLDAFLGLMESFGFDTFVVKPAHMDPGPAKKTPRKTAKKAK